MDRRRVSEDDVVEFTERIGDRPAVESDRHLADAEFGVFSGSERTWARLSPQIMRGIMRAVGAIMRSPNMSWFNSGLNGQGRPLAGLGRSPGRRAPRHPGGVPNLSDEVACEAYSHEVSSAGFWPGGGGIDYPAFYSYAYPMPEGFRSAPVRPEAAFFSQDLREFVLPYDAVRTAASPDTTLQDFLQSTYEAAADAGKWDRAALECAPGIPGVPRAIT
jgi:hypothetical protein